MAGVATNDPELCFSVEELDYKIIPHIAKVCQEDVKKGCCHVKRCRSCHLQFTESLEIL